MTSTPEARIAKAMDPHLFVGYATEAAGYAHMCTCGHFGPHHEHLAAVIANLPDIAVVELPTPVVRPDLYDRPQNDYLNWGRTLMYAKPEGMVYRDKPYQGPYEISSQSGASGQSFSMASARQYAAALLACADEAERLSAGHESFRDVEHREAQARRAAGGES